MSDPLSLSLAQNFLDENFAPWIMALKPQIMACADGSAQIDIPITSDIERVGGIVCGQAMGALADTTMVFACFSHMQKLAPVATTTLDTQFLRPASGDVLSCIAKVERAGKALFSSAPISSRDPAIKSSQKQLQPFIYLRNTL